MFDAVVVLFLDVQAMQDIDSLGWSDLVFAIYGLVGIQF